MKKITRERREGTGYGFLSMPFGYGLVIVALAPLTGTAWALTLLIGVFALCTVAGALGRGSLCVAPSGQRTENRDEPTR